MEHKKKTSETENLKNLIKILSIACVSLAASNFGAIGLAIYNNNRTNTVVTPATLQSSVMIQSGKATDSYLEQMGLYFAQLFMNVTPSTIDTTDSVVLQYVEPAHYKSMKSAMQLYADKIKRQQITQTFYVSKIDTSTQYNAAVMYGDLKSNINQSFYSKAVAIRIVFNITGYGLTIKELVFVDPQNVWGNPLDMNNQDVGTQDNQDSSN